MKNRVQEVGILLSLGVSKIGILGQILLEALMIAILAITLSFTVAPSVSHVTANYLVTQQIEQAEVKKELDSDKVAFDFVESQQEVTGVNVDITPQMLILDGVGVIALISLSILTAGTGILRKNPKDILSEMS